MEESSCQNLKFKTATAGLLVLPVQNFCTFIIHVFPAKAGIQERPSFLLGPSLCGGFDEHQNAKLPPSFYWPEVI